MILFISIFSFLLDGILSIYAGGIWLPLLTIVSLVLIYPYFCGNDKRYFRYIAILGLLYDVAYANTVFFHFFIFVFLGFVVMFFYYWFSNRFYISVLVTVVLIIVYRLLLCVFYNIVQGANISLFGFIESVYSSLLLNIGYCLVMYGVTYIYSKHHHIAKSS